MNQSDTIIKLTKKGYSEKEIEENIIILFFLQAYSRKAIYKQYTLTKFGKENKPNEKLGIKENYHIIDQSWLKLQYDHSGAWILLNDDNLEVNRSKILIILIMISIILGFTLQTYSHKETMYKNLKIIY